MTPGRHFAFAAGLGLGSSLGFALSLFSLGLLPFLIPYLMLLGSFLFSIQGVRAAVKEKGNSDWAPIFGFGCGAVGLATFGFLALSAKDTVQSWQNERSVDAFCAEKGVLRINSPQSVKTASIRFTPNNCHYKSSNALCSAAEYPSLHAPKMLAAGFEFVEFDISRHTFRGRSEEKFVRLFLVPRPNSGCYEVDRSMNDNEEISMSILEKSGVPRNMCVAAVFGEAPKSTHQFVLTTTEDKSEFRKDYFLAELRDTRNASVIATVESIAWGGNEKSFAGFGCRNSNEFDKLLNLVVPLKPSK